MNTQFLSWLLVFMAFLYLLSPKVGQEDLEYNLNSKNTFIDIIQTNSWQYTHFTKNLISDKTCYHFHFDIIPNTTECSKLDKFYWKRMIKCESEVIICK